MRIKVSTLCKDAGIDARRRFSVQDIETFLSLHSDLLSASWSPDASSLYRKWNAENFTTLLEILWFLGKANETISIAPYSEHPQISDILNILREDIFWNNSVEQIFYRFIQSKAMASKDVEYGRSAYEQSRYADLSEQAHDAYQKMQVLFENGQMFRTTKTQTLERLRRERKIGYDILFTAITKHPTLVWSPKLRQQLFQGFDMALIRELEDNRAHEYGSHHHVLYGMINGNDDFAVSPWLNPKSNFNYLCLVAPLLEILRNSR